MVPMGYRNAVTVDSASADNGRLISEVVKTQDEDIVSRAAIRIKNLSKTFYLATGGGLPVFSNLSLDIEEGSFVAILGPSGCGKSTLLRIIAGLESFDNGIIEFGGHSDIKKPRVGLMLQQYPSLPWLTVNQNIELALDSRNVRGDKLESKERAMYYLSRVGLFGWQDAYPRELSGGMLQRLALARTLAMEPDVVLLDEPLGALDALTRHDLQCLIRDLHEAEPKTYVMVTHDVDEALAVADRLIVLGPVGTGVLYDSNSSDVRLDRNGLISLLRKTHVTFAAGTWSGYNPVHKSAIEHGTRVYDLWLGMSDQERAASLRSGRAVGALVTIQSLVNLCDKLSDIDPVVVHAFSQPLSPDIAEHILLNSESHLSERTRWALPEGGLENAIVRRIDSSAFTNRVISFADRSECVRAVERRDADACIADVNFAQRLLSSSYRRQLKWLPLPDDIWPDLWTLLIVPRRAAVEQREALKVAVQRLALDASSVSDKTAKQIRYLDPHTSAAVLRDGTLESAYERWGGKNLPIMSLLLG
jgi:ABC-type nitrate/sulfonate/bicarbonate transport system ATPase subunit